MIKYWRLSIVLFLFGCEPEHSPTVTQAAFYHWQTQLEVDSTELAYWKETQAERLYVKFFDVDWDAQQQQAIPKATVKRVSWPPQADIVPTIFITNRTFQKISVTEIATLAKHCLAKIEQLWPDTTFTEIQFDCDWSSTTRENFFSFLRLIREQLPRSTSLSATIRLHQYRYPVQTGVPPVDRGMLMFYNMGDLDQWEEPNSILNLEKAKPYLQTSTYPLPLDIALPLFRWSVLFREGKMIKLLNGLDAEILQTLNFELDTVAGVSYYRVPESQYWQAYYLYEDDYLRPEAVSPEALLSAAALLNSIPAPDGGRYCSFYHLDREVLSAYDPIILQRCKQYLTHENNDPTYLSPLPDDIRSSGTNQ